MALNLLQDGSSGGVAPAAREQRGPLQYEVLPQTPLLYSVRLIIKHPDIDPDVISKRLRREPLRSWKAGDPRTTPDGTVLPGVQKQSAWSITRRKLNHRAFFDGVTDMLNLLERHSDFVTKIIEGGGEVSIGVQLSGRNNIGASFKAADMGRMSALGVSLGIEVFPDLTR